MNETKRGWSVEEEAWRSALRDRISGWCDEDMGVYDVRLGEYSHGAPFAKSDQARALMALLNASEGFITREHIQAVQALCEVWSVRTPFVIAAEQLVERLESLLPPAEQ